MKTTITITGQISSVSKLRGYVGINQNGGETKVFNTWYLFFDTKKEATKCLSMAYKEMREDRLESVDYRRGDFLSFDAGTARIIKSYKL